MTDPAEFFARLITNQFDGYKIAKVEVRGAVISGDLDLTGPIDVIDVRSEYSRYQALTAHRATFTGDAAFVGSTFAGSVWFSKSTFTRDAAFAWSTFTEEVGFAQSTFTGDAWFARSTFAGDAWFTETTFSGKTVFSDATFTGAAWFSRSTFAREASFSESTFAREVTFAGSAFTEDARFNQTTFAGEVSFDESTFSKEAWFDAATFTGEASFNRSTFTGEAFFGDTRFIGEAWFAGATFGNLLLAESLLGRASFLRATFNGPVDGAWAARTVDFDQARFLEPVTVRLLCPDVRLTRTELRSRGTLQLRGGLDGTAATFSSRTTLADPGVEQWENWLPAKLLDEEAVQDEARTELAKQLLPLLKSEFHTTVSSLQRATVADLELSAVDLSKCRFAGAHGLDKMRIDSACTLPTTPSAAVFWKLRRFTRRIVIAEEGTWRNKHATWDQRGETTERALPAAKQGGETRHGPVAEGAVPEAEREFSTERAVPDADPDQPGVGKEDVDDAPDAATIAGIYRALRKGLEDSGNEPGAADFYYGEMEMRRLARRETKTGNRAQPRAESALLAAYWAVSGYGLRASRAIAAIVVLILVGSVVFWTVGVQNPPGTTSQVARVDLGTGQIEYAPVPSLPVDNVNLDTDQAESVPVPAVQADKINVGSGELEYTKVPLPKFTWPDSLEFAARTSVALLRIPSGAPELTGIGTVVDITLRLLVPVLLGLAALAIRGRTKR
ncbi:pentapeptide repeat-containing protein [Rhodococcus pyridinivorans]|uniref:Pentapeptide repeat-containing protein n=1 Tax=Rhodococcus pyridinivorans TaxID=103816 RepID=A0A7M2XW73_9NOCA|nr:pentapeptide repeat-containing protein [Rhodococcus pyridinivorans]QOW01848.1 pentapeptide repeat-containing protein [Rhodococcus pyridinivorans]